MDGICTTTQQASYYSPVAADIGRTSVDLQILEELSKDMHLIHDFEKLGLNCFCSCHNLFVFKDMKNRQQWYIGMFNYKKSGAVAWPVKLSLFAPTLQLWTQQT